jgi:hypothetical protein
LLDDVRDSKSMTCCWSPAAREGGSVLKVLSESLEFVHLDGRAKTNSRE